MRTVELSHEPPMSGLYVRGAVTATGRGGALPEVEVVRRGVGVDRDRLAAYDRVCGFGLRDRLPATYLHVTVFPLQLTLMADRGFPLALPGLVHLRNRITQHRPVDAGERLDLRATARRLRPHARGAQVDLVGEVRVGDELVWEGLSTYLARGTTAPAVPAGEADEVPGTDAPDLSQERPAAVWRVGPGTGRAYAAVSGDVNPIHLNPLAAKAFGFPRAIAHGMWLKARALAALESRLPTRYAVDVTFRKPVLLPSSLYFVARQDGADWAFALRRHDASEVHLRGAVEALDG